MIYIIVNDFYWGVDVTEPYTILPTDKILFLVLLSFYILMSFYSFSKVHSFGIHYSQACKGQED